MAHRDLEVVADLHLQSLGHGLFPQLGASFLRRYHRMYVDSPHCLATVAERSGVVVGFVVATLAPAAHDRWLREHALLPLALAGIRSLLLRPRVLVDFLTTRIGRYAKGLWRRVRRVDGEGRRAVRRMAVLQHVAVDEDARGLGLGAALVAAVETAAAEAGAAEIRLVTPAGGPAEAFYEHRGWFRFGRRRARDGSEVTEFRFATTAP